MIKIKSPIEVTVIRRFNAAAERAFDAWLDPEMLAQYSRPFSIVCRTAANDKRTRKEDHKQERDRKL
jgi:uncharacterized protein YndB with AHSA1/START domain